jgi:pyruvate,orthophosphate dikinase
MKSEAGGAERIAVPDTFGLGCGPLPPLVRPEDAGFKAYNLWRMARLGLPVPQAVVIGTRYCRDFLAGPGELSDELRQLIARQLRLLEAGTGLELGSARKPLVVSVRSGAPVSMPGMMDTVLDVGLNETSLKGLLRCTGNPRLVWDSYRRFAQSWGCLVGGADASAFDELNARHLRSAGVEQLRELDFEQLMRLARESASLHERLCGAPLPESPAAQVEAAVRAVFASWRSERACQYRALNGIDDGAGTAVTIQRMVYGNAGGTSGSGVGFTRHPATGEPQMFLEYLSNAQGEDVVGGRHAAGGSEALAAALPAVHERIQRLGTLLEREFGDMQEFEFTVQDGELFLLQTRAGKRTPWAALRIAVDQVREGLLGRQDALARLEGLDLDSVRRTRVRSDGGRAPIARALPASPGVASGGIALDTTTAIAMRARGLAPILVRLETSTEDIAGLAASEGVLTATGGRTSHAAVVARQLDRVCLVGCAELTVRLDQRRCVIGGRSFAEGDLISLDGESGAIYAGKVVVSSERPTEWVEQVRSWARSA